MSIVENPVSSCSEGELGAGLEPPCDFQPPPPLQFSGPKVVVWPGCPARFFLGLAVWQWAWRPGEGGEPPQRSCALLSERAQSGSLQEQEGGSQHRKLASPRKAEQLFLPTRTGQQAEGASSEADGAFLNVAPRQQNGQPFHQPNATIPSLMAVFALRSIDPHYLLGRPHPQNTLCPLLPHASCSAL